MLIGRERELAEVTRGLDAVASGEGRLFLVTGPAGIGKSCFLDAVGVSAADRGFGVARAQAVDDPGAPALWPWSRVVRGWPGADRLPAAEPGQPDAATRFARFEAVTDLLVQRASDRPLLVVLDDLHWADPMTLQLLSHVVRSTPDTALGLLVASRDAPLPAALAGLSGRERTVEFPLGGLVVDDVARWLPHLVADGVVGPHDATELHAATGGNPLFVKLMVVDRGRGPGADPVLPRLAAARLGSLDDDARHVVEVAAVLGERGPLDLLEAGAGQPVVAAIAAAGRAGVLRTDGDGYTFEHALVRDAALAALRGARRRALHRAVAVALAQTAGVPAGPVALHWEQVGGLDGQYECLRWSQRADDEARAALDHDDAVRFAELADTTATAVGLAGPERAEVLIRLAEARFLAGRVDASLDACRAVAPLAVGRPDLLARAGLVVQGVGDASVHRAVAALCEDALAALPAGELALRSRLRAQIAVGLAESEGGPRPAELAADALHDADASGDPVAIVEALAARHLAISVPASVAERLELGRRAVRLGESQGRTMPALWGHLWRADAALQLGNVDEFDHELREIDRVATVSRSIIARWHHLRYRAAWSAVIGEFAAARDFDDTAFDLARRSGQISLTGLTYAFRSQLAVLRGDPGEMPLDWRDVLRRMPPMPLIQVCLPQQLALAGRVDDARIAFEPFRALPAAFPVGVRWAATVALIGQVAVLLDDAEVAGTVHDLLADTAHHYSGDGSGAVFCSGANDGLLGDLAFAAGRPAQAVVHQRDALAMNLRIGARPYVALARLGWARAASALPSTTAAQRAEARDQLDQATAEFRRLDMPGPLRTAEAVVVEDASPLSAREREIAALVGESLSNREIAERLVLSERTVETHVRNILQKLGFARRTEIVAWVLSRAGGR